MRPLRRNLLNPVYLASRIYMRTDAALRPDRPWFGPAMIRYLDSELAGSGSGWEWGSGRSTAWLGRRLRRLVSVESDPGWHRRVSDRVRRLSLDSVELRLVEGSDPRHYGGSTPPEYAACIDAEPDASLDLVLVDGDRRHECIRHALQKVRPGGLLVVDNTGWAAAWGVPEDWPLAHRSANYLSETTAWRRPR